MRTRLALAAWAVAALLRPHLAHAEPPDFAVLGTVARCAPTASGFTFEVMVSWPGGSFGRPDFERLAVEQTAIPLPAAAKAIVKQAYRFDGRCPAVGAQVRVRGSTACVDCPRLVDTVEDGGPGETFDSAAARLWITRQYFDDADRPHGSVDVDLFLTSQVLAGYNRRDNGRRPIWIRDRLERGLSTYSSPERAAEMVRRFSLGRADLAATREPGQAAFRAHRTEIGLVKGVPYMPADPRDSPFIGEWGIFGIAAYAEAGDRATLVYDVR